MSHAQLISAQELHQHLNQPNWVILDCRFSLENPGYGHTAFLEGHIPGAFECDLDQHLSSRIITGKTGRHPLPTPEHFSMQLRHWGVNNDSTIVLYDDASNAFSARAWWLLAWLGKRDNVFILDGGFKAWQSAGYAVSQDIPEVTEGDFTGTPDPALLISAQDLQQRLNDTNLTLLDARAHNRFRGEDENKDPVAGHIPNAQCAFFMENLQEDGRFLPAEKLKARFSSLLADRPFESLVTYCGSGVTACHNLFALSLAGYPLAPLYAGSWSEWILNPDRPVATGA